MLGLFLINLQIKFKHSFDRNAILIIGLATIYCDIFVTVINYYEARSEFYERWWRFKRFDETKSAASCFGGGYAGRRSQSGSGSLFPSEGVGEGKVSEPISTP